MKVQPVATCPSCGHDFTIDEWSEIYEDFCKCSDLAMMAASYWPEASGVWVGTISERLNTVFALEHDAREKAEHKGGKGSCE